MSAVLLLSRKFLQARTAHIDLPSPLAQNIRTTREVPMDTFRCQNPSCCKQSDYSLAQIRAKDSTVQCQHCQTMHRLEVVQPKGGSALQLRAGGLYWNPG